MTYFALFKKSKETKNHVARIFTSQTKVMAILDREISDSLASANVRQCWLKIVAWSKTKKPGIIIVTEAEMVHPNCSPKPIACQLDTHNVLNFWIGSKYVPEFKYDPSGTLTVSAAFALVYYSDKYQNLDPSQRLVIKVKYQELASSFAEPWQTFGVRKEGEITLDDQQVLPCNLPVIDTVAETITLSNDDTLDLQPVDSAEILETMDLE